MPPFLATLAILANTRYWSCSPQKPVRPPPILPTSSVTNTVVPDHDAILSTIPCHRGSCSLLGLDTIVPRPQKPSLSSLARRCFPLPPKPSPIQKSPMDSTTPCRCKQSQPSDSMHLARPSMADSCSPASPRVNTSPRHGGKHAMSLHPHGERKHTNGQPLRGRPHSH